MKRLLLVALACGLLLHAGHAASPQTEGRKSLRALPDNMWRRAASDVGALLAPLLRWRTGGARAPPGAPPAAPGAGGGGSDDDGDNKKRRPDYQDGDDPDVRAHWAVLVAGSSGWGNYRHQADVYHAYQILLKGGLLPERMIVMAYDDIAINPMNPAPGKVFNRPGGPDVYAGVRIDYRGDDVTADNFLAVLRGDRDAVTGKGSGRVLGSGPRDKVFLFYSDHGAAGVLGMPTGPFLYADQLHSALRYLARHDGYKEMVLYIEACESGSMFEGLLDNRIRVYATTAANAVESSWATYCPTYFADKAWDFSAGGGVTSAPEGQAAAPAAASGLGRARAPREPPVPPPAPPGPVPPVPPPAEFTTCLGDLYSVAWMEDAESEDMTSETLEAQFHYLRLRTSNNFSYVQGSHVMRYGDVSIDAELAGDYMGMHNNGSEPAPSPSAARRPPAVVTAGVAPWVTNLFSRGGGGVGAGSSGVGRARRGAAHADASKLGSRPQRDADLIPLAHAARASPCPRARAAAAAELGAEVARRRGADAAARGAAALLLAEHEAAPALLRAAGAAPAAGGGRAALLGGDWRRQQAWRQRGQAGAGEGRPAAARRRLQAVLGAGWEQAVEGLVEGRRGGEAAAAGGGGRPVVEDWGCLRGMVQAWEGACGRMDQYAMRHTRLMAALCNAAVRPRELSEALFASGGCTGAGRLAA